MESRPGAGSFVRASRTVRPVDYGWQTAALSLPPARSETVPAAMRTAPNDLIALHSGYPDRELLPERLVRSALARAARSDAAVSRPPVPGLPELQAWFARELATTTPPGLTPPAASEAIILPGSQSGLSSICRAVVGVGEPLLMESPTYWGAIRAATHARVRIVPIPSTTAGPDPDELQRAFQRTGARAFYAQPHFANPTGAQWTSPVADRVLEIVRDNSAFLIEDDWAHDFGITTTPTPIATRDESGHVIYLRSLTKSVSPTIRVAALIARGPTHDRILADQGAQSMYVSGLLQAAALDILTQPAWQTHLRSLRAQLKDRRDLLYACLQEHAPALHIDRLPTGGLNLWVRLPDATDPEQFAHDAQRSGVFVAPGTDWFPAEPAGPFIRLSFAGPNPSTFAEAAHILGKLSRTSVSQPVR